MAVVTETFVELLAGTVRVDLTYDDVTGSLSRVTVINNSGQPRTLVLFIAGAEFDRREFPTGSTGRNIPGGQRPSMFTPGFSWSVGMIN